MFLTYRARLRVHTRCHGRVRTVAGLGCVVTDLGGLWAAGRDDALLECNADYWYLQGVCVHKPCSFRPGADPTKQPLLSSDVGSQVAKHRHENRAEPPLII